MRGRLADASCDLESPSTEVMEPGLVFLYAVKNVVKINVMGAVGESDNEGPERLHVGE